MPNTPPASSHDADLAFLLGKIDGKCDNISAQLAQIGTRADKLEERVAAIENSHADRPLYIKQHNDMREKVEELQDWRIESTAQIAGAAKAWNFAKVVGGVIIAVLGYIGYQVELAPAANSATSKTVQTITVPASPVR